MAHVLGDDGAPPDHALIGQAGAGARRDATARQAAIRPAPLIAAGVLGMLFAATLALWAHYGTAVFVETIVAGLDACF